MRILSKFDFLGVSPKLNIGGDNSNKTIFGGFMSLGVVCLLLLGSTYFMYLLFSRTNYSVISSDEFAPNSFVNYTSPEVALYLANRLGEFLPDADRLYSVIGTYWYFKKIQNPDGTFASKMTPTFLKMEKCNLTRHFPNREELWRNEKFIKDSYCVAPNQIANISKPYGFDDFTGVIFWVQRCQNTTVKKDCFPRDVIDKTIVNVFLLSRFTNFYFDHSQLAEPARPFIQTDGFSVSSTVYKRFWYSLKNVEYSTDAGIFLPDSISQNYTTLSDWKESVDLRTDTTIPDSFVVVSFNMNLLKQTIIKRYYKFQNMLADMGGLLKGLISIAMIINWYFCNKQFYNDIINASINSLLEKEQNFNFSPIRKLSSASNATKNFSIYKKKGEDQVYELENSPEKTVRKGSELEFTKKDNEKEDLELYVFQNSPKKRNSPGMKEEDKEVTKGYALEDSPRKDPKYSMISSISDRTDRLSFNKQRTSLSPKTFSQKDYKKSKFSLSCSEYLFPICCFGKNSAGSKRLEIHYKYRAIIFKQFDVLNMLPKFHDIDKISYILTGKDKMYGVQNSTNPFLYKDARTPGDIMELRNLIFKNLASKEGEGSDKL